ncbi:hypothetical protein ACHAWU_001067 [Discostella pseudostelligera]|uniref:Splicing factor 3A subunit 1 n=1 Tax=Discostella pseudostelligera TaxID=259834 RepID=A0ABD3MFM6_9STRA
MVIAGIIRPPPDIRAVADRTALFVSKNGRAFEIKILNSEKGKTPKFAFLHGSSPFHAYYEDRIRFYEEGGTDEEEKRKEEEERLKKQKEEEERLERERKEKEEAEAVSARKEAARKKASAVDPVARALLGSRAKIESAKRASSSANNDGGNDASESNEAENTGSALAASSSTTTVPPPPPPLRHVSLIAPANLSHLEVEIIKLTAQYVALSSSSSTSGGVSRDNFLTNLTLKEWSNPQFAFLQPRHGHYAYFTALVDGYRSFLPGGEDYERAKNKARMDAKKDRLAHLILDDDNSNGRAIGSKEKDRHSAVLRECLERAAYRAEYERDMAERKREAAEGGADGGLGGAGTIDWHDFVVVETIEFPVDEVVQALPPPTSLRLAVLTKEQAVVGKDSKEEQEEEQEEEEMEESSSDDDNVDMDDEDDGGEKLKVVSNYQPKVVSTKEIVTGDASRTHIIDPISGKSVAIADMPEHMRIQLLDPKWAEERKRFLDKQRETNFVAGEDIASNISRFLQARGGDLFGSSASDIHDQKVDSEKRLMEANRLIREQAMQPMPQPQGVAMLSAPAAGVVPPPPPPPMPMGVQPPVFAPPMPPPPPQQQYLAQPTIPSEEPEAKRLKVDDPSNAIYPPAPPGLPIAPGMVAPGVLAPPPPPPPSASQTDELLSESDFIATLSDPNDIPICIRVPHDPTNSNWNFNGQTIDITVKATSQVKELKEMLTPQLGGMPMNKMQLKHPSSGFMNKDGLTMAYFNVGPMTTIDLVPKTRGGRK